MLTSTEAAVLGLLIEEGEQSGYDLSRQAARSVGYFWSPVQSRMYATLPQLVERGFARSREVVESNRFKQLYRITPAGKSALREWLHEPPEDQPDRNPLLLKLFLADGAEADDAILLEHVREKRRAAEQLRDELVELEAAGAGETTPYAGFTREYGRRWAEMMIGWTTEVERVLARRA